MLHLKVVIWWVPVVPPALPAITPLRNWVATGKNNTSGCTCWHTCRKEVSLFGPDSDIFGPPSLWVGAVVFPDKLHKFKCKTSQGMTLGIAFCVYNEKWGLSCLPKGTHLGFGGVFLALNSPWAPLPVSLGAYPTTLDFPWKWPVSAFFKKHLIIENPGGGVGVLQSGDCWAFVSCKQPGMPALSEKVVWLSHGRL